VALVRDSVLAVTKGVPELDRAVARAGNNLSVVGGEGDGEDIVSVSNKSSGGSASGKLPKTESLVPRGRESVGTVRGDDLLAALEFRSHRKCTSRGKRTQSETM
jgi:hypothetical protein